jgi:hypothetical protein
MAGSLGDQAVAIVFALAWDQCRGRTRRRRVRKSLARSDMRHSGLRPAGDEEVTTQRAPAVGKR